MEYIKNFEEWNTKKQSIEKSTFSPAYFSEGEVWWLSIGINIGCEEDEKSQDYSRPVLIVKKFNNQIFIGIPLTTQRKDNPYYIPISFGQKTGSAMISQIRSFSSKRLTRKMGKLEDSYYKNIVLHIKKFFNDN
jgi:mRNA interferase MazF